MRKYALIYHSADVDGLTNGILLYSKHIDQILNGTAKLFGYNYELSSEWMDDDSYTHYKFVGVTPPIAWLESLGFDKLVQIYDNNSDKHQDIINLDLHNVLYYFDTDTHNI